MDHALNWIWQGIAIALAAFVLLRALGRAHARDRFRLCAVALAAIVALPVIPLARALASPVVDAHASAAASEPVVTLPDAWWTADAVLLAALVAWIGVQLVRGARSMLALRRLRDGCRPFPASTESQLWHWSSLKLRGRPSQLVLSSGVRSAAVLGGGSPLIAVSPALVERLTPADLDRVIVHEWAHVQRRDDLLLGAQTAVRLFAGWHPAVWKLDRQLQVEREAACDEMVVRLSGSGKRYAASLAVVAGLPAPPGPAPALGAVSTSLEERVRRILSYGRLAPPSRSAGIAVGAASVLCVLSFTTAGLPLVGAADAVLAEAERHVEVAQAPPRLPQPTLPSAAPRTAPAAAAGAGHVPVRARTLPIAREALTGRSPQPDLASGSGITGGTLGATPHAAFAAAPAGEDVQDESGPLPGVRATEPATLTPFSPPSSPVREAGEASPWRRVAAAGTAVGHGARQAGTGTAGFFTRFGKRIAASF